MTGTRQRQLPVWTKLKRSSRSITTGVVLAATGFAGYAYGPAMAQQQQAQTINAIEVLINDRPISTYDINQRLSFVIAISGGVKSEEELSKVREEVIRNMIDERLQIQEAEEFEATLTPEELDEYFVRRAQSIGQSPEQFETALGRIGSSKQAVVDQLHAEVVWGRIVQGRFNNMATVTDEEVQSYIERQKANKGEAEYRIAEIVLPVRSADADASVKRNAEVLVKRLRGGASFPDIAQQLSSAATAASGGDMGWIALPDMPEARATALDGIEIGGISDPIRTAGSYVILSIRDRRRVMEADELDTRYRLAQYFLEEKPDTSEEQLSNFRKNAAELRLRGETCDDDLSQRMVALGGDERANLRPMTGRDMPAAIRSLISELEVGEVSELLNADGGLRAFILCEREVPEIREPNFDDVQNQLEQQRLSMVGRRYLRDIRREAIIDYR